MNDFTTSDINLATWLIICEFDLKYVHWMEPGHCAIFWFNQVSDRMQSKIDDYEHHISKVEPHQFVSIKRRLYDKMNEARRLYFKENPEHSTMDVDD